MVRFLALFAIPIAVASFAAAPIPEGAKRTTWPMFGGSPSRNNVNLIDRDIPSKFDPEKDCLWKADLGSRAYGGPIVAAGKVFVGTNNERPRNLRDQKKTIEGEWEPIDLGVLMCFDERTGKFLWQAVFDKLKTGQVNDWPKEGICSSPVVEGNRLYFVSNRCTVVCADVNGLTDGRQGEVIREKYTDAIDADFFWEFDMRKELKVYPHNMSNCSPLIVGDLLFICTSNGVDESHWNIPSPEAPSFIALNKKTGKLVWKDSSPGKNIMHGQWCSPAYAADPVPQVIFGGGDGWLYAFDPPTGKPLWKFDGNPKNAVYELGAAGTKCDFIAAPVIDKGRLFIGVGQDPEHTSGIGCLWCLDLKKAVDGAARNPDRDVSSHLLMKSPGKKPTVKPNPDSASVWVFGSEEQRPWATRDYQMGRTLSNACIVDDILYLGELAGYFHCFDAKTGEHFWNYDTKSPMWFGPSYVDGKIYFGNDNGDLYVFKHVKKPQVIDDVPVDAANRMEARAYRKAKQKEIADKYLLARIEFDATIRSACCAAGGVLYVMTEKSLYAIGKGVF